MLLWTSIGSNIVISKEMTEEEARQKLQESIEDQLNSIDFWEIEQIIKSLDQNQKQIFGNSSFLDRVRQLLNGNYETTNIFSAIFYLILGDITMFLPILAAVVGITALCSLLNNLQFNSSNKGVSKIIYYACYGAVILSVSGAVFYMITLTKDTVELMQNQISLIFPILLGVLTAIGGTTSVAVYQPMVSVLSVAIIKIMVNIILPLFIFGYVFNIVGNLSSAIKLKKFAGFTSSFSKWLISIIFTVFTAFMSIQGITASVHDGISIRTAKFAISHYIPIVGGYLSDGFNLIMAGSVLIKNAVGVAGLFLLASTVLAPVIKIMIMILTLKLTAAILEPLAPQGFSDFVSGAAKSLNMLTAIILSVAFMYFIMLLLIVCTGNFIWG
ncbi:MAG TPA: stage III sporulation protein AE [Clostridia bacterium]